MYMYIKNKMSNYKCRYLTFYVRNQIYVAKLAF